MLHVCLKLAPCRRMDTAAGRSLEGSQKVHHLQCVLILPSDSSELGSGSCVHVRDLLASICQGFPELCGLALQHMLQFD